MLSQKEEELKQTSNSSFKNKIFMSMLKTLRENNISFKDFFFGFSSNHYSINFDKFQKMMRKFGDFSAE
jgi:hypothetical protein